MLLLCVVVVVVVSDAFAAVASLKIYEDGRKEFRVLNCISRHPTTATTPTRSAYDAQFCVGCLSPPELQQERKQRERDDVYVFSRYWDVVSDKSLFAHFFGIVAAPLVECVRAMLIYLLLSVFQARPQHDVDGAVVVVHGPQLRTKILRLVVLMTACDVLTRRLTLWIKSGLLVTVMSFASVLLDQLALVALYTSLAHLYPTLAAPFRALLSFELGISCVNMAAIQLGFLEFRSQWHPAFKEISRWDYRFRHAVFLCGVGKELLTHLLLLLPLQHQPSLVYTVVGYLLVPLFTIATGMDFVRGLATLLHLLQYPWLGAKELRGGAGKAAAKRA